MTAAIKKLRSAPAAHQEICTVIKGCEQKISMQLIGFVDLNVAEQTCLQILTTDGCLLLYLSCMFVQPH